MAKLRELLCWVRAIPDFFLCGEFVPHTFRDSAEKAIIISTETGFRVSDNYQHFYEPGETVHKNAGLIRSRCIHCGKEELSWFDNWDNRYFLKTAVKGETENGRCKMDKNCHRHI